MTDRLRADLLVDQLPDGACDEARAWLGRRRSADRAWRDCRRGDWMLWLLARCGADRRTLVLAACDCAELALVHVLEGEDRPRIATETARRWAQGTATLEEVRASAYAAYATNADTYADTYAANAAGYAAAYYAANAAGYAAAYAAATYAANAAKPANATYADYAAYAATYAAKAATYAAYAATLAECARIVRRHFPDPPEMHDV